jgi:hypothetical protein
MRLAHQFRIWRRTLAQALIIPCSFLAWAENISEYQVKAAYLYNFAKFVEWPAVDAESASEPFRFCVLDEPSFEAELKRIVNGKTIAGRPANVVGVQNGEQSRSCQILFISSSHDARSRPILDLLHSASVLTVGESERFLEQGGVINFVLQEDRVHFQVNRKAANEAGLRISARLLSVAKLIIE